MKVIRLFIPLSDFRVKGEKLLAKLNKFDEHYQCDVSVLREGDVGLEQGEGGREQVLQGGQQGVLLL